MMCFGCCCLGYSFSLSSCLLQVHLARFTPNPKAVISLRDSCYLDWLMALETTTRMVDVLTAAGVSLLLAPQTERDKI